MSDRQITPEYVDGLIDRVGRGRVFARAEQLGWANHSPPLWVWYQICLDLIAQNQKPTLN